LGYANSPAALADPGLREQLRNPVIQCFEFTYALSWKMLKRHLEATDASPEALDQATFQGLIRLGNARGLLRSDWNTRRNYRQARTPYRQAILRLGPCSTCSVTTVAGTAGTPQRRL
jgi:hypothetical protein